MEKYLFPHQVAVANFMASEKHDRLLLFHSLGSGKTFTSLACARLHPHLKTVVITGGGYAELNFKNENSKFNDLFSSTSVHARYFRWKTLSNGNLEDTIKRLSDSFIIVDEVHNLRAKIGGSEENKSHYFMGVVFRSLLRGKKAKLLLMTGTPIVDNPSDMESIGRLMDVGDIFRYTSRYEAHNNYKIISEGEKISGIIWPVTLVEMVGEEAENYKRSAEDPTSNRFCSAVVDSSLRSKYIRVIEAIKKGPKVGNRSKAYIYCERVNGPGIRVLKEVVRMETEWKCLTLTNETRKVEDVAGELDKAEVVIGSNASCESINIYDLSQIHIVTPHWNESHIRQAIGRGTRLRPEDDNGGNVRIIKVFRYAAYLEKPVPDISFSVDLYKYYKSSLKAVENASYLNSENILTPDVIYREASLYPPIAVVLDIYEELIQNKFCYVTPSMTEEVITGVKSIGKSQGHNIQLEDESLRMVNDSLVPLRRNVGGYRMSGVKSEWLSLFYYIRSLVFDEKTAFLEEAVLSLNIRVMKFFRNSIFLIEDKWYHTFLYREPRALSYNVSYCMTKQEGITRRLMKTVAGASAWASCSVEEEKEYGTLSILELAAEVDILCQ